MLALYHDVSKRCAKFTTHSYSTSFGSAIRMLNTNIRQPIYNIYGFVRVADEIVDTFHDAPQAELLQDFREETWKAIKNKISTNPILNAFQITVNEYEISHDLIEAFFHSMEMDLNKQKYQKENYEEYIYGSAEVVGLMCLKVFCGKNIEQYESLITPARHLGAAFQKINFLRDLRNDALQLDRMYFPNVDFDTFTQKDKEEILADIKMDFDRAYEGVKKLPSTSRFGVLVAYKYYYNLYRKISRLSPVKIKESRVRIPNYFKAYILLKAQVRHQLNLI